MALIEVIRPSRGWLYLDLLHHNVSLTHLVSAALSEALAALIGLCLHRRRGGGHSTAQHMYEQRLRVAWRTPAP